MFKKTMILGLFLFLAGSASASVIYVPDDYPTIQDAVNASLTGDIVIVRPGFYFENIRIINKTIALSSEKGPHSTVIHGNGSDSVIVTFNLQGGAAWGPAIYGFTITNGNALDGGGIRSAGVTPVIANNIITGNKASNSGGGILVYDSDDNFTVVIKNNVIADNEAGGKAGGGLYCYQCPRVSVTDNNLTENTSDGLAGGIYIEDTFGYFRRNTFSGNYALEGGAGITLVDALDSPIIACCSFTNNKVYYWGGAIYCNNSAPHIVNSTLVGNASEYTLGGGGAVFCEWPTDMTITNSILWGNSCASGNGKEIFLHNRHGFTPSLTIGYSDVEGGQASVYYSGCILNWGSGMIDSDPLFADATDSDYHLTWDSPCKDTGDNTSVTELHDFEGDPRVAGGTVDMGADEFYYHLYHIGDVLPGGSIDMKVVGPPGASPVRLALGSGIQDPPQSTPHGDLWLALPLAKKWQLGAIPSTGILIHTATVPTGWAAGSQHPLQALVGPWGGAWTKLTNLMQLEVE